MSNKKFAQILLGALPVDIINATLGVDLEPGDAILTARAHKHIARDNSADYAAVMTYLQVVIAQPTYIGQSPHHGTEFELVRRVIVPGLRRHQSSYKTSANNSGFRLASTLISHVMNAVITMFILLIA